MKLTNSRVGAPRAFIECNACHERKSEDNFAWKNGKRGKRCKACRRNTPSGAKSEVKNHKHLLSKAFET